MNPLYNMLMGQQAFPQQQDPQQPVQPQGYSAAPVYQPVQQPMQQSSAPQFANPMQKANYILQAMRNPAAFVRQAIPGLPPQIANDPNQILQWMQQNGMVTQQQIQEAVNSMPRF